MAGSFRGFGGPQAHFAAESHMDEIAKKLEMDPLDLRLMNMLRPGTLTATSQMVEEGCGLEECIKKAIAESDWYRKRRQFQSITGTKKRGLGLAIMYHGNSLGPEGNDFATVHMQIDSECKIRVLERHLPSTEQEPHPVYFRSLPKQCTSLLTTSLSIPQTQSIAVTRGQRLPPER